LSIGRISEEGISARGCKAACLHTAISWFQSNIFRELFQPFYERLESGVSTLASGAGGADGAIAWGGAPQRGAQPQEYEVHDIISSGGAADFKKIVAQNRNK
jgi:hypothetical protein